MLVIAWLTDISNWTLFVWSGRIVGVLFVPFVLMERTARPMSAVAWILALLFIPYLGAILWWILGRNHFERTCRQHSRARRETSASLDHLEKMRDEKHLSSHSSQVQAANPVVQDEYGHFPWTTDNHVAVYRDAATAFDVFADAIERAEDHVHVLFYVWKPDDIGERFRQLFIDASRRGVAVRVLFDAVGSLRIGRRFLTPLQEAGVEAAPFLPVRLWEPRLRVNFRNHRKLVVVDGRCGFTGGINLAEEYLHWFDMAFGFHGPVVQQMQEVFAEDWYFTTGEDLASRQYFPDTTDRADSSMLEILKHEGPLYEEVSTQLVASGPDDRIDRVHKSFFQAINDANRRLHVITPYFVPDNAILTALQTAAMRGVDVRIILPARSDVPLTQHAGRFFWEQLLESGVRIYEYQAQTLHAKLMILDDDRVSIGSANMDIRSFRFNFEANCIIDSRRLNRRMSDIFRNALNQSDEVDPELFSQRPRTNLFLEGTARLFSPLL